MLSTALMDDKMMEDGRNSIISEMHDAALLLLGKKKAGKSKDQG